MRAHEFQRVRDVFDAVVERSGADRDAILAERCGTDFPLRERVEVLLRLDEETGDVDGPETPAAEFDVAIPARIGRYRIRKRIGEGGMGVVYLAEQDNPARKVALKVLKGGFLSTALQERFTLEASLLGRLQHPRIAQIYEAGTEETMHGTLPFFAMEFVDGRPIHRFAREEYLDVRARLALVAEVADAVHHAHQKRVVHRDLKPANVLVDESGAPHIVDFGVALAVGSASDDRLTRTGQLIGTVSYMSPEQCEADPTAVDTRTDIYSLGVIAYELLAGVPPHDLESRALAEATRAIRDDEPTRLGLRSREFRGEIETIVGKAMAKDRDHRYDSAAEFAADLRRYLANEPITARPASGLYQLRKLASRHKPLVAAFTAVIVILLVTVWWVAGLTETRQLERSVAQAYSEVFFEMKDALKKIQSGEPVEEVVRAIAMKGSGPGDSGVTVELLEAWADLCESFYLYDQASDLYALSLERRLAAGAELDRKTIYAAVRAINPLVHASRLAEAESHCQAWLARCEAAFGPEDENSLRFRSGLAAIPYFRGELEEAARRLEALIEFREDVLRAYHPDTCRDRVNLARLFVKIDRPRAAIDHALIAYDQHSAVDGFANPLCVEAQVVVGAAKVNLGDIEGADEHFRAADAGIVEDPLGNDLNAFDLRYWRAKRFVRLGEPERAREILAKLEPDALAILGADNRRVARYRELARSLD